MNKFTSFYINPLCGYAQSRFNLYTWWALAVVSYVLSRGIQAWLDASYAASKFPVPFYIGQTTFDAAELKGYFAKLIELDTLNIYIATQLIDFVFIVSVFVSFYCLTAAIFRSIQTLFTTRIMINIAKTFIWLSPLAGIMDACENLVSFVMLLDPLGFSNWLVYPYSTFAVIKFFIFSITYLWAASAVLICFVGVIVTWFKKSKHSINVTK